MKFFTRFVLCMVVGFLPFLLKGQTADQYQFTATTGTFTAISGGTAVPTILADGVISSTITLPFTFAFEGTNYTTAKVSSDGFLSFLSTATNTGTNNLATTTLRRPLVAPLWDDLDGRATGGSTASYVTTGTSPNQVFTFEWKNWEFNYASTTPVVSFQVKLYETTHVVEFWYQSESGSVNLGSASIGLAGVTSGKFLSVQSTSASPATSSSTEVTTISTKPASNTVYRFTPPLPCVAPTAQPTALVLTTVSSSQINGSFTAASPAPNSYLVVRYASGGAATNPVDGTSYTAGAAALGGTIVQASSATTFNNTGLTQGTTYDYKVYSYNNSCSGGPLYFATMPLAGSQVTTATPIFNATIDNNWSNVGNWSTGALPTCNQDVVIAATKTCNLDIMGAVARTITNNGTLVIPAATSLTVSNCAAVNTSLFNNVGILTVSGGTLTINGNFISPTGSTFTQSDGAIIVDGNAAGVIANSVASGTHIFNLNTNNLTLSGGTLTIVDPHANTSTSDYAFRASVGSAINATTGHTLRFGDGVSTDPGGTANGFYMYLFPGVSYLQLGNVEANGSPSGANRHVSTVSNIGILGNLTVNNANGDYRITSTNYVNGNVTVNAGATLTTTSTLGMASYASATLTASTNAQTIGGAGTFRNSTTTSTASLVSLTINNSNAMGVTLNVPLSISGTLTMTAGLINTTTTNLLTLGTTTLEGTLSGTPTATNMIVGPFARTFGSTRTAVGTYSNTTLYPVGKGGVYAPIFIDPTTTALGAVVMTGEFFNANSGTAGTGVIALATTSRWEALVKTGAANFTSSHIRLTDARITTLGGASKILQATTAAGSYEAIVPTSIYAPATLTTTVSQILSAAYRGYLSYGTVPPCTAPANQGSDFVPSVITSTTFTGTFTAATSTPTGYLVVRYPTGSAPTTPVDGTTYTVAGTLGLGTVRAVLSATTFNETGLTAATAYDYYIYAFNNQALCFGPAYNATAPLMAKLTTCPTIGAPGTPTSSLITGNSFTATWTASSTPSATYLLDISTSSIFTSFVAGYNAKPIAGLTENVTGLSTGTTYYVRVRALSSTCPSSNTSNLTVATIPLTSIATGNWNDPATWSGGTIPTCTDGVNIAGGFTVTVNSASSVCRSTTIATGSTLVVASGDLTVGCTSNNNPLTVNGVLTVSNGTLNNNGNINIASTGTFNQSGGTIKIDGNAAGVVGSSVASGTPLFNSVSNAVNLTGGTLLFVDPHVATSNISGYTIFLNNGTAVTNTLTTSTTHTTQFGDGVSTDAGGHTSGFYINAWESTTFLSFGNVIINGGTGTNRNVASVYQFVTNGNLTVNASSNLTVSSLIVGGNIMVNTGGVFVNTSGVTTSTVLSNDGSTLTYSPVTTAQTFTNNGTFSNLALSPTANFTSLGVNNTHAAGLTLANDFSISNTLTHVAGIINMGSKTLTIGINSTTLGTYTYTAGRIVGKIKKWITPSATAWTFPIGSLTANQNATVNFTAAPSVAGTLTAQFVASNPTNVGLPLAGNGSATANIGYTSPTGYWTIAAADGLTGGTYNLTLNPIGFTDFIGSPTSLEVLKRVDAASPWTLAGTFAASSGTVPNMVVSRTGLTGFSDFAVGMTNATIPIEFMSINAQRKGSKNVIDWATANEIAIKEFAIERSINNKEWSAIGTKAATGGSKLTTYSFNDEAPAILNYYRIRSIETTGKSSVSKIVAVKGESGKLSLISVSPIPTTEGVTLDVLTAKQSKLTTTITDIMGRVVKTEIFNTTEGNNSLRLSLSNLATGAYILRINDGDTIATQRIVKQ